MIALPSIVKDVLANTVEDLRLVGVFVPSGHQHTVTFLFELVERPKRIIECEDPFGFPFMGLEDGSGILHVDAALTVEGLLSLVEGPDSYCNLHAHGYTNYVSSIK